MYTSDIRYAPQMHGSCTVHNVRNGTATAIGIMALFGRFVMHVCVCVRVCKYDTNRHGWNIVEPNFITVKCVEIRPEKRSQSFNGPEKSGYLSIDVCMADKVSLGQNNNYNNQQQQQHGDAATRNTIQKDRENIHRDSYSSREHRTWSNITNCTLSKAEPVHAHAVHSNRTIAIITYNVMNMDKSILILCSKVELLSFPCELVRSQSMPQSDACCVAILASAQAHDDGNDVANAANAMHKM